MQHFSLNSHLNQRVESKDQTEVMELITRCLKGDRKAQKALYDALSPKMFSLCIRYMGDRDAAEDILQEGFVSLFAKLDSYTGNGSFEGWARKIFVNTALMSLRKNDILRQSEDIDTAWSVSSQETSAVQNISYRELIKIIGELPSGFRTVFNMYVIEGYSHKEIADELGISEATSRSQLLRARLMLQEKIKK